MNHYFVAIDYGAKLAGTTVVCFEENGKLYLQQSSKKQDADEWLRQIIEELNPVAVFMDAPLSLPGVYHGHGNDFHYRACDRAVGAMSPMFLGGLTARAMQVRAVLSSIPFYEIYPAQLVKTLFPGCVFYKKELTMFLEKMTKNLPLPFAKKPENWHQVDAALAWLSGWRHSQGAAKVFGAPEEGLIWV